MTEQLEPMAYTMAKGVADQIVDNDHKHSVVQGAALMSIAISLKRIADEVTGHSDKMGMTDGIMHAIEQGIIAAGQR